MVTQTGTATNFRTLLDDLVTFTTNNNWVLEKSVGTGNDATYERYLRGPGSSATAPVYVSLSAINNLTQGSFQWDCYSAVSFDTNVAINLQVGSSPATRLLMREEQIDYWFFVSDRRIIVIAKSGIVYNSLYAGFFLANALPTEYPFPTYLAATSDDQSALSVNNSGYRSIADPGLNGAYVRSPAGIWEAFYNHDKTTNEVDDYQGHEGTGGFVWPYYAGNGDADDADGYSLPSYRLRAVPGGTDDTIILPVQLINASIGAGMPGTLDGVFYVPGFLANPEQTFSIGTDNYIIFPNGNRTGENHYFAVRDQ